MRFDDAATRAIEIADEWATVHQENVIVVRDLLGRNALALEGSPTSDELAALRLRMTKECAPFVGSDSVIVLSEMFEPRLVLESADRHRAPFTLSESGRVSVIERGTVGAEWLMPREAPTARRVTLYGFKGGVGRSTATFALAQHLANIGKVVLVVDLDLESPGVSTMLAPDLASLPPHGILDHLVEHGVANADGLELVARSDSVGQLDSNGEVWFSAAAGRPQPNSSYLDKLSRAYLNLPANPAVQRSALSFGERLEAAVSACEAQVTEQSRRPDVVLLDSRSGIHDIAAVAITQLSELSFLFATDNPQTWQGYGDLFTRWQTRLDPNLRSTVRDRVQMVAALVPQSDRDEYLRRFADHAQTCFARTLYDDEPTATGGAFNFAPQDNSAPHYPIPIHHSIDLIGVVPGLDPRWRPDGAVTFAYADFLRQASEMILEASDVES